MKRSAWVALSLVIVLGPLVLHTSSSFSQEVQAWSNLGLYGGRVLDIAIDPINPEKMFAGSVQGDGLFVTTNGGSLWQAVETENEPEGEGTFKNHAVLDIEIAPSDNNVIWVAHNNWVEKSTDGGQSWTHIYNSDMQRDCLNCGGEGDDFRFCYSVAVDPYDAETIYVGAAGPENEYSSGAIYRTQDGGETWTKMKEGGEFDHAVVDLTIDPQDSNVIWAVTNSWGNGGWNGSLYRGEIDVDAWIPVFSANMGFRQVEVKPDDSNQIFTGTDGGLFKHFLDGEEWTFEWILNYSDWPPPAGEVWVRWVWAMAFDPQDPDVLYAAWRNPWADDKTPKFMKGTPPYSNSDWEISTIDYHLTTLAVHPKNSEVVLGGGDQGASRSEDKGKTWIATNEGINALTVSDVAIEPNDATHLLAGTPKGVYEKQGSSAWSKLPLPESTSAIRFHPTDSETFFAGLYGSLAKTTDGGQNWAYKDVGVNDPVRDIAIDPVQTDTLFIAVGGEIQKSRDGGENFDKVLEGEDLSGDAYPFNVVVIDPSDHQHIFAGGGEFYSPPIPGDLWESRDGGDTWTRTGLQNVIVNSLLVDPRDPHTVYAGCGYSGGTGVPVFKSSDGGATWAPSYDGIPDLRVRLTDIWGASSVDVFTVGKWSELIWDTPIFRYDGSVWSEMDSGIQEDLYGVWGSSSADVFAVGASGIIVHYDGSGWSELASGTGEDLNGVWGTSSADVFAVGASGIILHYDGSGWSELVSGTSEDLNGVWGTSSTDVLAVGAKGTVLHYDGSGWSELDSATSEDLNGIWGSSPADVFAVGESGTILHYNGSGWSELDSGTSRNLYGVWGSESDDVFAVGADGMILLYDGGAWLKMDNGIEQDLYGVWGTASTDVFVGGRYGAIHRYNGSDWAVSRPAGEVWNCVTDMEFHTENRDIVYASTLAQGVYVSIDQADNWLNLGTPEYYVHAISTSSLFAGTQGGMLQCTGTGVITGSITDQATGEGIHHATILCDLGAKCRSIHGKYMMVNPAGIGKISAIAEGYANETVPDVTLYGGDVARVDISMASGLPEPRLPPGHTDLTTDDGGGYCFIATAAYGSPLARQVQVLREFRNTYLLSGQVGRRIVDRYYRYGRGAADMIESHRWLKPLVRLFLYPAVGMAWLSLAIGSTEKAAVGLALVAFLLVASRRVGTGRSIRPGLGPTGLFLLAVVTLAVWGLASSYAVQASTIFKQVGIASSPNPVGSGARAMGMAGAFIAMADDATAASWNPGGLVQVEKPEISVVGAYFNRKEELTSGLLPDVRSDTAVDGANLNYLSVTYPFRLWTNWVVSLNYQRLYDFKRELDYTQDFRDVGLDLSQDKQYFQDGYLSALGIAGAVEILPRFSFGATFNLWTDQLFWRNGWEETFVERAVGTVADEGVMIDTHIQDKYEEFRGINFNIGLLWNPFNFLTVGAVVKTPFTASVRHEFRFRQVQTFDDPTEEPIATEQSIAENVDLKMPISYGIGIAGRISDALSVDLDVYRTHWSDYILEDSQGNKFSPIDGRPEDESDVKDTTMVRLGAEYLVIMEQKGLAVPVRGGFFYDPEPAHGSMKDFFGIALGSGVAYKWVVFDLAYQLRWGTNVDTGNLIATTEGDIIQHNLLFSLILHL